MLTKTIKFYSTEEKLPERSGRYLCFVKMTYAGYFALLSFSKVHGGFNLHDGYKTQEEIDAVKIDVAYWAYTPEMNDNDETAES